MTIEISVCDEVDEAVVAAFAELIPQLSGSSPPPTAAALKEIVAHDASTVLLAIEEGVILGSMTLVLFPIPTGTRAWIEDVVVDESARGRGVGEALNRRAMKIALEGGAQTIDLTSRPAREAANRLYQRLGFAARETNIYRYEV
ncbi:MAG TPA: GNAT family N-acetyltransferase [Acidimicrobiales bacterium]|jgi:ribosomal protein S18 acetylase RimI-like enzyme|nr:GNAT family N-acetyltransferase [Acidimicrobiales bacterium]|tara:strand:+ start:799 stop:1230 length:432 start_codon:yes stop_codon:yes gene_type:complete